ncbi:MAG: phage gp6-like head-tail connector protein, partial [Trueperaceae bacterium]|nr:phage gp6-like head-tail connector protein [Trueperaceae bacterium]
MLVPLAGVKSFLNIDTDVEDHDTLLTDLIDEVERAFLREAGRADLPFQETQAARTEVHDGTGAPV